MAKGKKESFAEMFAKLQDEKVESKVADAIEERQYFLIVCEGVRTEPIYFTYLKNFLPKHLLQTIEIRGAGDNTINVARKAIEERDERLKDPINPPFDEVWAVFDKDDFPAKHFNQAVQLCSQYEINSGHTNEAFELWYLLHFQYLDTSLKRKSYFKILSDILGSKYEKNSKAVVEFLFKKGNVRQAIEWAHSLKEMHEDATPADACPSTQIHILVERLLRYSNHPSLSMEGT